MMDSFNLSGWILTRDIIRYRVRFVKSEMLSRLRIGNES